VNGKYVMRQEVLVSTWGSEPWESDAAADWFGHLMQQTDLPLHIDAALNLEPSEYPEEIRAAAFVLGVFGRNFIYPLEQLDGHLKLAIQKLRVIKALPQFVDQPDLLRAIDGEIAKLEANSKT
jgi:hypothetical protein